jgi:putative PIN family toxin of toxin-antitoxin system
VVEAVLAGRFLLVSSPPLLSEFERVLRYPRLAVAFPEEVVGLVGEIAMLVKPGQSLSILRDEADNRLLEAAAEAAADYIVTGDRGLLALERYGTTIVVTPRSFLEHLDPPA